MSGMSNNGGKVMAAMAAAGVVLTAAGVIATVPAARSAQAAGAKQGAKVPDELLGTWRWTTINASQIVDKTSGRIVDNGGGMSVTFTFLPGGRYKKLFYTRMQSRPGWVTEATSDEEGVVESFGDGSFVIRPTKSHYKGSDSMTGKKEDRMMRKDELGPATYHWRWADDGNGGRKLMIGPSERSMSHFRRAE